MNIFGVIVQLTTSFKFILESVSTDWLSTCWARRSISILHFICKITGDFQFFFLFHIDVLLISS